MGEYVNHKILGDVKLGVCEDLFYASYEKLKLAFDKGLLSFVPGNQEPEKYLAPGNTDRFRFPFPDEDNLPIGYNENYNRGVSIQLDYRIEMEHNKISREVEKRNYQDFLCQFDANYNGKVTAKYCIEIIAQRFIENELWTVVRCPECRAMARLDRDEAVKLAEIVWQSGSEGDEKSIEFFQEMARRILDGYGIESWDGFPDQIEFTREQWDGADDYLNGLFCESCNKKMTENELKDLNDSTAGIAGDGSALCFGCAKKLKIDSWVRLGADRSEQYEGLE